MSKLLFLAHRIPYPPNKGDKIRSFHLLRYLSTEYQIFLGTFIDNPDDWQYTDKVREFCVDTCFEKLSPVKSRIKSLAGFLTGEPLTIPYYRNHSLQKWVDDIMQKENIDRILIFSSSMAQYISKWIDKDRITVIDFVDVDSDKWKQYASSKSWPESAIYRREAKKLFGYEQYLSSISDMSVFVSESEANMYRSQYRDHPEKVTYVNNGVDTDYFTPLTKYKNPYGEDESVIIFTGAMDYWANVDAVTWFCTEVLPSVREYHPAINFYIVGSNPTDNVMKLENIPGVTVTGAVKDIRPYIAYAKLSVAPMRIARGVQNKVLEAMAMSKLIVVTPQGLDGIKARNEQELFMEEDSIRFADKV
ncbi:MAG: TIGR03087 family PEP-CTERM/XrtA system glycosyltransferase, partial [Gammaproteobacteria bacterium]|nr:TIGR03087 family PEP-CTERM/XrtA system glycosyltransferase [Gammaproteobacteria bacterium]